MPAIANPKMEAFAQHRAAGHSQIEAYRLAGYERASDAVASRLSRNVKVSKRLKELQALTAQKYDCTIDTIARDLDEDRALAYKCNNPSAAVAASLGKAKLFGLLTDKSVVNVTHNYASMTEEEIRFEIAAIHAEARALKAGVRH